MSEDVYEVWTRAYEAAIRSFDGTHCTKIEMVDRARYIAHKAVDDFRREFKIEDL